MARARNIKPAFFKNEHIADMPLHARLLFIGLWTLADREGRLQDRPRKICAEIFPYEAVDVSTLLDCLEHGSFITRYCVNNEPFIQISNWHKHQNRVQNLYLASCLAIDPDDPKEERYLERLGDCLGLDMALRQHLDHQARSARQNMIENTPAR